MRVPRSGVLLRIQIDVSTGMDLDWYLLKSTLAICSSLTRPTIKARLQKLSFAERHQRLRRGMIAQRDEVVSNNRIFSEDRQKSSTCSDAQSYAHRLSERIFWFSLEGKSKQCELRKIAN